jgi:hypothetical protein
MSVNLAISGDVRSTVATGMTGFSISVEIIGWCATSTRQGGAPARIFGAWRDETEADLEQSWEVLKEYQEVEPVYSIRPMPAEERMREEVLRCEREEVKPEETAGPDVVQRRKKGHSL